VFRGKILEGQYVWEEGDSAKNVVDSMKSSLLGEGFAVDAKKAPIWQPATAGVNGQ